MVGWHHATQRMWLKQAQEMMKSKKPGILQSIGGKVERNYNNKDGIQNSYLSVQSLLQPRELRQALTVTNSRTSMLLLHRQIYMALHNLLIQKLDAHTRIHAHSFYCTSQQETWTQRHITPGGLSCSFTPPRITSTEYTHTLLLTHKCFKFHNDQSPCLVRSLPKVNSELAQAGWRTQTLRVKKGGPGSRVRM